MELDVLNSAFGNGKNKGKVTISPPVKLYFDILRVFDNELLINLYWQCLRYLKFLYPQRNEKGRCMLWREGYRRSRSMI